MTTQKMNIAVMRLKEQMGKKARVLPTEKRKSFLEFIMKHSELLKVKGKRLILGVGVYEEMVNMLKLDDGSGNLDHEWYIFFRRLRKYKLIHPSSSYFPKKLAFISINPNPSYLFEGNLSVVDDYVIAKSSLYCNFDNVSLDQSIQDAYIDLRLYQLLHLQVQELERLDIRNIIFTSEATALIYVELNGVFSNIEIPPYQLIPIKGKYLVETLHKCAEAGITKPFAGLSNGNLISSHRSSFYTRDVGMQDIYYAGYNYHLRFSSPLSVLVETGRKTLSPLTISELQAVGGINIPKHLIELEDKRVSFAFKRAGGSELIDAEEKVDTELESIFSLSEFDELDELFKIKLDTEFLKQIPAVKKELTEYIDATDSELHGILICQYVLSLLDRIDGKNKIRISTFKDYISLLKRHLFENIEDISNVEAHEINDIILSMSYNQYAEKSIRKVRALIKRFFKFNNQEHNLIKLNLASYPKSLVLDSEIDDILEQVGAKAVASADRVGTRVKYKELRDKAIILFARYTGMRKNELRGRYMRDIWIIGSTLYVDVNPIGMKNLDMKLKTKTAKRRIYAEIKNQDHIDIIKEYMASRKALKNKNKYLFLDVNRYYDIASKPMRENIFDDLNSIIQSVTGRYTSFHSFRHSYASYEVKRIIENPSADPHQLIDLAVRMGHESPETTLKIYAHRSLLEMGGVKC
jgi:site-specific recombinase XerD